MAEKDYRAICTALRGQGWALEKTGNGHYKATPPGNGSVVFFSSHAGDHRAIRNTLRDLRASGFEWPVNGGGDSTSPRHEIILPAFSGSPETDDGESADADVDAVFAHLKSARDDHALAVLDVADAEAKLEEAKRQLDAASKHRETTAAALRDAKQRFDQAFALEEGK